MDILYLIGALILGAGLGIGTAFFVCASMLKNSNDMGDSVGTAKDYTDPAVFTVKVDRLKSAERECFHNINEIPLAPLYSEPSLDEEVHKLEKK